MLISQVIANLFNGISQQPAPVRHGSQCELQENYFASVATGLRKRMPTQHIDKLQNGTSTDGHIHFINRDSTERYVVLLENGAVKVFSLADGTAMTVSTPDGVGYLACTTPRSEFSCVTVADYTFVVNKTILTALDAATVAGSVTGTVQTFADLPATPTLGDVYKIEGTPSDSTDDYHVKWDGAVWVETALPGETYKFDPAKMPHILVRTGVGTFDFKEATWDERLVGDKAGYPDPSFVGKAITDVFFYRKRLGFLCGESFVLSRSGKVFNFWLETATAVLDTDPIDESVSTTKVSTLHSAIAFNKALMLFADQGQFQLTAGDALTPRSVKVDQVTSFASDSRCKPVGAGSVLLFALNRGEHTAVREYYVEQDSISSDANDTTAHVPAYIPKNTFKLAVSTVEDVMFAITTEERNKVYTYKYLWNDQAQKVQSAWSKYTFDVDDIILGVEFIESVAYFVIQRADGLHLEKMIFQENRTDSTLGFLVHLDRRVELTGVYNAGTGFTTWTLPYADSGTFTVVRGSGFGSQSGNLVITTRPSSTTLRATGDYSAGICYVGRNYTARYRFSEQYVRLGQDKTPSLTGTLQLRRMFLNYTSSSAFVVEVTPRARSKRSYQFTSKTLGSSLFLTGEPTVTSGTFKYFIKSRNLGVVIDLVNDSYLPSQFQSAEWEGEFTAKSRRV